MIDVFGSLRSLFKVQRISEDTMIFRLHYRATVALLLGGCVTLACKSISGSPIHCEASGSVDKVVLETFCWLHTTYSMVHAFNMSLGQAVPYPGVSNSKGEGMHGHASHPLVKQHKYYQWVIFFLLLQVWTLQVVLLSVVTIRNLQPSTLTLTIKLKNCDNIEITLAIHKERLFIRTCSSVSSVNKFDSPARPNNGNALSFNKSFPGNCYTSSSNSNQVYFLFENPLNGTIAIFQISRQAESSRFEGNGTLRTFIQRKRTCQSSHVHPPSSSRSFKIQRWCKQTRGDLFASAAIPNYREKRKKKNKKVSNLCNGNRIIKLRSFFIHTPLDIVGFGFDSTPVRPRICPDNDLWDKYLFYRINESNDSRTSERISDCPKYVRGLG